MKALSLYSVLSIGLLFAGPAMAHNQAYNSKTTQNINDAETGVVMLIYLDQAYDDRVARGVMNHFNDLMAAVKEGAVQRIHSKMMTMVAILFGLLPIMWSTGFGSEVMKRIAAPMIDGVVTSVILGLLLYVLWRGRQLPRTAIV